MNTVRVRLRFFGLVRSINSNDDGTISMALFQSLCDYAVYVCVCVFLRYADECVRIDARMLRFTFVFINHCLLILQNISQLSDSHTRNANNIQRWLLQFHVLILYFNTLIRQHHAPANVSEA